MTDEEILEVLADSMLQGKDEQAAVLEMARTVEFAERTRTLAQARAAMCEGCREGWQSYRGDPRVHGRPPPPDAHGAGVDPFPCQAQPIRDLEEGK